MTASEVRRLALPAILHSLLQTLVFVVDRVMLGRHGEASLAAMQLGGAVEWSIWSVFAAFEVGTIARVGRHVGAGDTGSARRAAWISLVMAGGIGSALALASPFLLRLLPIAGQRVSPAALAEAHGYLSVTMAASPLVFISMTSIAALQAGGDTRTPLAIGVIANIVHIACNWVLIPRIGAQGAGISTALTFALEAALSTGALSTLSRPVSLRGRPTDRVPPAGEIRRLARIALPAFLERVLYHTGFLGYVLIVTLLGDATMAANQSLISVESICFLSADGFGIAAAALVAQRLGAGDEVAAKRAANIATRDAMILLTTFGLVSFAFRDSILPIFTPDREVIAIGRSAIWVLAVAQPFMAAAMVLGQSLRGAGKTREALGVSIVGALLVRLSMTWLFAITLKLGLAGVWIGSTIDWMVRAAMLAVLARRIDAT